MPSVPRAAIPPTCLDVYKRQVQSILKSGRSVRAEQSAPEGLRVRQTLRLGPDGAVPVTGGGGIC